MKSKTICSILAWLLFLCHASADTMSIDNVTIPQGGSADVSVKFSISAERVGFKFAVGLPSGLSLATDPYGETLYTPDNSISRLNVTVVQGNQFGGMPKSPTSAINGLEGTLLTFTLQADASLEVGSTYTVIVSQCCFSKLTVSGDPTSGTTDVNLPDFTFTVTIGAPGAKTELRETDTSVPVATSSDVDIVVYRTLKANDWNTICLPFSMTASQAKTVFGDDFKLCDFVNYEYEVEETGGDITNILVNFENVDLDTWGFEANHPYLIKVSSPVTQFEVRSKIDPDEEGAVMEYDNGKTGSRRHVLGTFYGTLHAGMTVPENCLFISGNNFYYSAGSTTIKAFRGYFDLEDILSSVEGSGVKMQWNVDDVPTAIDVLDGEYVSGDVYTLQGIHVGRDLDKKGLPNGIYIVNGKKVLVK